jgi:hypothetical protein
MTPRERVLEAVQHRETDRVPLFYRDVPQVSARLRRDCGLQSRDELLEVLEVDFRWVRSISARPWRMRPLGIVATSGVWNTVASKPVTASIGSRWSFLCNLAGVGFPVRVPSHGGNLKHPEPLARA